MSRFICSPPGRPVGGFLPVLPGLAVAFGCLATTLFGTSVTADAAAVDAPPAPVAAPAVGPYDPAVTYPAGSLAIGADGNTYRASKEVKGVDPTQAKADAWHLAHVSKEVILDVPARFPSIGEAMAFLDGCRIAESAKVVVLVAPGKLEHDKPLVLNHVEGARIVIRGAGEKPEDCVLAFDGCDGVVVNGGGGARLENLSLSAVAKDKGFGLVVAECSKAFVSNCRFDNFRQGLIATNSSYVKATNCEFVTAGSGNCVMVEATAAGTFTSCSAKATGEAGKSWGFSAVHGGAMNCTDCAAENWYSGFTASMGGAATLVDCIGRKNMHGVEARIGSSLHAIECTFASNQGAGLWIADASAVVQECTLTANNSGITSSTGSCVTVAGKPTRITNCKLGLYSQSGGRFRIGTEPVFRNVELEITAGRDPGDLTAEEAVHRF